MALLPQPLPWTACANREIADASGSVVQYTLPNVGAMCLAVNAHDRMMGALQKVEAWMSAETLSAAGKEILALVKSAVGKIGIEALVVKIESITHPSAEVDRAIATELQVPEAQFTTSVDAALLLVLAGWKYTVGSEQEFTEIDHQGNILPGTVMIIDMIAPDGRIVVARHRSMAIALAAAAVGARGLT